MLKRLWCWLLRARIIRFSLVGGSGYIVSTVLIYYPITLALHHITALLPVFYLPATIPAAFVGITWNYFLNKHWTFGDRKAKQLSLLRYELMGISTTVGDIIVLFLLVHYTHIFYLIGSVIATVCMYLIRYLIANKWIWGSRVNATTN